MDAPTPRYGGTFLNKAASSASICSCVFSGAFWREEEAVQDLTNLSRFARATAMRFEMASSSALDDLADLNESSGAMKLDSRWLLREEKIKRKQNYFDVVDIT
jgi:hypothetical protein